MKTIVDLYPSHEDLVASFDVEVLLTEYLGSYEGDFFAVLRDGGKFGLLIFGYGSCSGCDALEASSGSLTALTDLRDDMWSSITWRSRSEMALYLAEKDFKLEWWGNSSEGQKFIAKVRHLFV